MKNKKKIKRLSQDLDALWGEHEMLWATTATLLKEKDERRLSEQKLADVEMNFDLLASVVQTILDERKEKLSTTTISTPLFKCALCKDSGYITESWGAAGVGQGQLTKACPNKCPGIYTVNES